MALPASDEFSGSNGQLLTDYNGSWTNSLNSFVITSAFGTVGGNVSGAECGAFWNADVFANDQYSEVVIDTINGGDSYIGPAARMSVGGNYYAAYSNSVGSELVKLVGAVSTVLDTGPVFPNGSTVRLEAIGTSIKAYVDGVEVMSAIDASHASGAAGIAAYSNNPGVALTSWEGGDIGAGSTGPSITNLSDSTLAHGQTSIVITGTNFSASGNTVLISPTDDVEDVDAVAQTITAESATEITFTADLDSFDFGATLYLFVINGDSESNETGEIISRVVGSATFSETMINQNGEPVANEEDITILVWRAARASGAPDQTITGESTDGNGVLEFSIDLGSLEAGDPVFVLLFTPDGTEKYHAGKKIPDYA